MRFHVTIWTAKLPKPRSDRGVSFWGACNNEGGNPQHLLLVRSSGEETLRFWYYAAKGMKLC